jgi:hypothetical protein
MRVPSVAKQGVAEGYSEKGVLGLVLIGTQLFTALTPFIPLIKLALQTVTKCLKSSVLSSILFKMRTFKNRNCKLRFMAFSTADVIIDLLQEKPGGSFFWRHLPLRGRDNRDAVRKKIADTLLHAFYDDNFISILLKGALDDKGKPRGDGTLYRWLLSNVYSDNAQKLYGDWLKASKYQEDDV